ncbi:MAG: oxidoreductase [Gammaproteobacteria bacterium]|nr:oxidoreductase [Gammaproteobacteria bacterium]|tara:strand:+ start:1314 stop:2063 length:750 start_codon:yes stop_codon:yes gene_type:complete
MTDAFRLDGKVAVVTGGGKGIGRGIALCLADAGADVVVAARTLSEVQSVAAEVEAKGQRAIGLSVDVTNTDQIEALAETAKELGQVDIWVNNAGGLPDATPRYLTRTPEDRWDAQLDLNLKAVFTGCVAAANVIEEGSIINIASTSARGANFKNGPYGASKAAVVSLTQSFSLELAPKIRVNAVGPGPIPTDNFNESTNFPDDKPVEDVIGVPLRRLGTPEDIGWAVVYMASPAASWVTGQCLYVCGGT